MKVLDTGIEFADGTTQTSAATGGGFNGSTPPDFTYSGVGGDGSWSYNMAIWIVNHMCYLELSATGQTYGSTDGGTGTLDVIPYVNTRFQVQSNQSTGATATLDILDDGTYSIGVNAFGDFGSIAFTQSTMFRVI